MNTCPTCMKALSGSPFEVGSHIINCAKEQEKAAAEAKKKALDAEKKQRLEEIQTVYKNLESLLTKYEKDYQDVPVYLFSKQPYGDVLSLLANFPFRA